MLGKRQVHCQDLLRPFCGIDCNDRTGMKFRIQLELVTGAAQLGAGDLTVRILPPLLQRSHSRRMVEIILSDQVGHSGGKPKITKGISGDAAIPNRYGRLVGCRQRGWLGRGKRVLWCGESRKSGGGGLLQPRQQHHHGKHKCQKKQADAYEDQKKSALRSMVHENHPKRIK